MRKAQVLDDFKNADLTPERNEYHFRTPVLVPFLEGFLKDKRDSTMVCLMCNIFMYNFFFGICIVYGVNLMANPPPLYVRNIIGLVYIVGNTLLFLERYILCLHYATHRPPFTNELLNASFAWVVAPFFGIPCGVYKLHHVVMHHLENNHDWDISSTEFYQRDQPVEFLKYYFRFAVMIWVELPWYCVKSKRWSWLRSVTLGLFMYATSLYCLSRFVNFNATFWVFMLPHVLVMLAMSWGNWCQHMFVDPTNPESNFALSYNCINSPVNKTTFNDGYHVIHHFNARLHWSELPEYFHSDAIRQKHLKEGALTFRDIHFFDVGIMVFTGQLDRLAEKYVHLGSHDTAPTLQEVEAKLRRWLVKMTPVAHKTGGHKAA